MLSKIEFITKRLNQSIPKVETSKLTRSHKDFKLIDVQRRVSDRIFKLFYDNYCDSFSVTWNEDPKVLYDEYLRLEHAD